MEQNLIVRLISVLFVVSSSASCPPWTFPDSSTEDNTTHCKCPPWTLPDSSTEDNTTHCKCGSDLGGVVECNNDPFQVSVLYCYCMTYNTELNETLVGLCTAMCTSTHPSAGNILNQLETIRKDEINQKICGQYKRDGQLCGECIEGYGPPVYSYSFQCVKCDKSNFKYNVLKYIAVAFVPLTGLYLLVIVFKFRATSDLMMACVMTCQLATIPIVARHLLIKYGGRTEDHGTKYVMAFVGIWNLDIFRSIYTPFCIHPDMTTLQVLALDYLVGVYPLVLIAVTYIAVMLHDRYPIVVRLWRPANKLCMCIRRGWDIRGSLVQAFATFLVLSYIKILNVSFDLLTPVSLQTPEGEYLNQTYLYYAGETPYFGREHLPYGILAVVMLTVFNILPVILLFLYPCSCCHKCLNYCHLRSPVLHTFMDTFQGCYHHKPRERRFFAALYLIARWIPSIGFLYVKFPLLVSLSCFYLLILAYLVSIFQPYKIKYHNIVDQVILSCSSLYGFSILSFEYSLIVKSRHDSVAHFYHVLSICILAFLLFVAIVLIITSVLPKPIFEKMNNAVKNFQQPNRSCDGSLPDRLVQEANEHTPLLTCT